MTETTPPLIDDIVADGRITRNARSELLFEVGRGDYVLIKGPDQLDVILMEVLAENALEDAMDRGISPDFYREEMAPNPHEAWDLLQAWKHKLPRTGGRPAVRS